MDDLALIQIERRLKPLRAAFQEAKVRPGWINYMRQALGITLQKLAERAGVSKPTVAQAERNEASGNLTVETLRKMAEAMESEFVYAFIPKDTIKTILREKAMEKATRLIRNADTHMTLEDQRVKEDISVRIERLANTLIEDENVW